MTSPEYDERTAFCARYGHESVVWRIRLAGVLHVRMLCLHCGCTRKPVFKGEIAA